MMNIENAANAVGFYVGSAAECVGDGLAWAAPSIISGSQFVAATSVVTLLMSSALQQLGLSTDKQTETSLVVLLCSGGTMIVGLGMNETAVKVQALGRCLQDPKRSLFLGC